MCSLNLIVMYKYVKLFLHMINYVKYTKPRYVKGYCLLALVVLK